MRQRGSAATGSGVLANGDFEAGVSGWGGYRASLSVTAGVAGKAARVAATRTSGYAISSHARPVTGSVAGSAFVAGGWVRSSTRTRAVCLRIREWAGTAVVGFAQRCVAPAKVWRRLPDVSYSVKGSGRTLDVDVYREGGAIGDAFDVDQLTLRSALAFVTPLAPPGAPSAVDVTPTSLRLVWPASPDGRTTGYRVSRAGLPLAGTTGTSRVVESLACGEVSTYAVVAVDALGAASVTSSAELGTAACTPPPSPSTPPPAPAAFRLYADSSPWNTPIPPNATVDLNSGAMRDQLMADTVPVGGFPIAVKEWTQPIYYADASTPRYDVKMTHQPYATRVLSGVPIPAGAKPDPSSDGQMTIIAGECEYDFAKAKKNADGTWQAHFVSTILTSGSGWYPFSESSRAAGAANAAGVIRPEDLRAGRIPHALALTMKNTKIGGPVLPATANDGWSTAPGAIPEGARIQLDPTLNLDTLGLNPWERIIARAMQEYGMFLIDTAGGLGLQAENPLSTNEPYPWGDVTYAYLPTSLVGEMRVLTLPPQYPTVYRYNVTPCATLR